MALSGTLISYKMDDACHYSFEWTGAQTAPGITAISWDLYRRGAIPGFAWCWNTIKIYVINGGSETLIFDASYFQDGVSRFDNVYLTSGSFTVTHATNGSGSFSVRFELGPYWDLTNIQTTTGTAILDTNVAIYTLSYNANGGSGAPSSSTINAGTTVAISTIKPTRTDYAFLRWNTKSDGTGTNYVSGANITVNSSITLYAIWGQKYTVSYQSNGATAGVTGSTTHYYGISSALAANRYEKITEVIYNTNGGTTTREDESLTHTFSGWNTKSDGSGSTYQASANVSGLSSSGGTVYLYAKWTAPSISLPAATRDGYRFLGWSTSASGSAIYSVGDTIAPSSTLNLYAQWQEYEIEPANIVFVKIDGTWHSTTWE